MYKNVHHTWYGTGGFIINTPLINTHLSLSKTPTRRLHVLQCGWRNNDNIYTTTSTKRCASGNFESTPMSFCSYFKIND
jgi:hypothetical protein